MDLPQVGKPGSAAGDGIDVALDTVGSHGLCSPSLFEVVPVIGGDRRFSLELEIERMWNEA